MYEVSCLTVIIILYFLTLGSLSPELTVLKAIAEEQRESLKRSTNEKIILIYSSQLLKFQVCLIIFTV